MVIFSQKLRENVCEKNIVDVTPDEVERIAGNFTKKNIVIFDQFSGECFKKVQQTQAL